ncbi:GyrI-like domain-containing protein [Erysipelothrix urinaevulpis]|uniref:AraC family transcriptional regulator n=1 Tax=Erysipelothrix urinaevulpis TaxID=2683717 RepID=UPI00135AD367|nr:GyrI-like domain-containing protein [Erysipelothrix urinaevulpis]
MKPVISIEEIEFRIIYLRHKGAYKDFRKQASKMFKRLYSFGMSHEIVVEGVSKVLTIYDDNPYITDQDNLRTSVAFTCSNNNPVNLEDEITEKMIHGKYAVVHLNLSPKEYKEAWENVYRDWITQEEYTLRDAPPFEMYLEEPSSKEQRNVDFYIPIQ